MTSSQRETLCEAIGMARGVALCTELDVQHAMEDITALISAVLEVDEEEQP